MDFAYRAKGVACEPKYLGDVGLSCEGPMPISNIVSTAVLIH